MDTKTCKRCGIEQPVDNFRNYYGRAKGKYTFCRTCERIEARRKYLNSRRDTLSPEQVDELNSIEQLYDLRAANNLAVPGRSTAMGSPSVSSLVDEQLAKLKEKA